MNLRKIANELGFDRSVYWKIIHFLMHLVFKKLDKITYICYTY